MSPTYSVCPSCKKVNRFDLAKLGPKIPRCGQCKKHLPFRDGVSEAGAEELAKLFRKVEIPVVVFFWKPFFGPCEMFAPVFSEAALKFAGKVVFCSLNLEKFPAMRDHYLVSEVPLVVAFRKNVEIGRKSGSMYSDGFQSWLASILKV